MRAQANIWGACASSPKGACGDAFAEGVLEGALESDNDSDAAALDGDALETGRFEEDALKKDNEAGIF